MGEFFKPLRRKVGLLTLHDGVYAHRERGSGRSQFKIGFYLDQPIKIRYVSGDGKVVTRGKVLNWLSSSARYGFVWSERKPNLIAVGLPDGSPIQRIATSILQIPPAYIPTRSSIAAGNYLGWKLPDTTDTTGEVMRHFRTCGSRTRQSSFHSSSSRFCCSSSSPANRFSRNLLNPSLKKRHQSSTPFSTGGDER